MNPFNINTDNPFIPHWLNSMKNVETIKETIAKIDFDSAITIEDLSVDGWTINDYSDQCFIPASIYTANLYRMVSASGINSYDCQSTIDYVYITAVLFTPSNTLGRFSLSGDDTYTYASYLSYSGEDTGMVLQVFDNPIEIDAIKLSDVDSSGLILFVDKNS